MGPKALNTKSPKAPIPPSTSLHAILTTLHLLYHHNKNQHRGTKWWRWLAMLKRAMGRLLDEVDGWEKEGYEYSDEEDGGGRKKKVLERMRYVHFRVVPGCYGAFTTVIADTQFSSLGVVLLAVLAQAARAVRVAEDYYDPAAADHSTSASAPSVVQAEAGGTAGISGRDGDVKVDVGEVVERGRILTSAAGVGGKRKVKENDGGRKEQHLSSLPATSGEGDAEKIAEKPQQKDLSTRFDGDENGDRDEGVRLKSKKRRKEGGEEKGAKEERKKKKKKKKGDAIDDIFGGL
ncbi:hypothetical protein AJ79_03070 [Helicocarpus griseus UAMH5409]|uniref:RNase MRP protein 1 RNA binding domain-containing protein n=1 Tax=Helicocarpus griseus UAMH5409 TaxID=1447875 RepID=A0A2B7Y145_9EURO|nr:hypothetical protein AJ79_03070 [Helicocarpus griseus UAMH5409]